MLLFLILHFFLPLLACPSLSPSFTSFSNQVFLFSFLSFFPSSSFRSFFTFKYLSPIHSLTFLFASFYFGEFWLWTFHLHEKKKNRFSLWGEAGQRDLQTLISWASKKHLAIGVYYDQVYGKKKSLRHHICWEVFVFDWQKMEEVKITEVLYIIVYKSTSIRLRPLIILHEFKPSRKYNLYQSPQMHDI